MKTYEKPLILANDDLFEGVFAASGGPIEGIDEIAPEDLNLPVHDTVDPQGEQDPEPAETPEAETTNEEPVSEPASEAQPEPEPEPQPESEAQPEPEPEPQPQPEPEAQPQSEPESQSETVSVTCSWQPAPGEANKFVTNVDVPSQFAGKNVIITFEMNANVANAYGGNGAAERNGNVVTLKLWNVQPGPTADFYVVFSEEQASVVSNATIGVF